MFAWCQNSRSHHFLTRTSRIDKKLIQTIFVSASWNVWDATRHIIEVFSDDDRLARLLNFYFLFEFPSNLDQHTSQEVVSRPDGPGMILKEIDFYCTKLEECLITILQETKVRKEPWEWVDYLHILFLEIVTGCPRLWFLRRRRQWRQQQIPGHCCSSLVVVGALLLLRLVVLEIVCKGCSAFRRLVSCHDKFGQDFRCDLLVVSRLLNQSRQSVLLGPALFFGYLR